MKSQIVEQFRLVGSETSTRPHTALFKFVAACAFLAFAATSTSVPAGVAGPYAVASDSAQSPEEKWGVEVIGVRSTAAGHMLEFRYRVLDSDKATTLFERKNKPHLIHAATGKVLAVPTTAKLGPLRNSNLPHQGRTYWMFFGNAGHLVKSGDKVTVAIGEYRSGEITVE